MRKNHPFPTLELALAERGRLADGVLGDLGRFHVRVQKAHDARVAWVGHGGFDVTSQLSSV